MFSAWVAAAKPTREVKENLILTSAPRYGFGFENDGDDEEVGDLAEATSQSLSKCS
jgi:hypothetical protein